tara:strand:- start:1422 stop:1745 length:324 start_codon:yes stop_codon:yes gene_type:complete
MNNISQIMKQAKEMQEKMNNLQKKIEQETVEGTAGGGLVKVTINGKHNAKKVFIDQSLFIKEESDVLEDLLVAAINDATKKISEKMSNELGNLSGGLNLPPGMKLPF